jgi:transcriptional regulator with XRE-family HTH domain
MVVLRRPASPFGERLRHWRRRAALSQLELAVRAGTTSRHVSFVETGRSRPGAELVLRLAHALDVPLRERNALLVAAGLAPRYPSPALTDEPMRPIALVLDRVLAQHEPYPAWVFARGLRALSGNAAAERLFPGLCAMAPEAVVDLWFGPGPFRKMVENWREVASAGVDGLRRDASRALDPEISELLRRAERHLAGLDEPPPTESSFPVVCPRFRIGDRTVRTISAVLRFDTAADVTTSELRVELMFPADEASDAFFRASGLTALP